MFLLLNKSHGTNIMHFISSNMFGRYLLYGDLLFLLAVPRINEEITEIMIIITKAEAFMRIDMMRTSKSNIFLGMASIL